jgi:iron complex outermembrane receptor protein
MNQTTLPHTKLRLHPLALAALLSCTCAIAQAQTPAETTQVGTITVTGEGDELGTGLMIEEEVPKAKSTITRTQLEKQRATSNPFQALSLLPGVNSASTDATGLFGGNLRVRGFNSNQMGFTIDGAPVNDSGSFAVYPQEYTDSENLCEMFVTQGATDNEAPHVGASGGNVGLVTCNPEDKHRVRLSQTLGSDNLRRSFVRLDTGKLGDFKAFISYSKTKADKWTGAGSADRDHVDMKADYKIGGVNLSAGLLYNKAVNNNYAGATYDNLGKQPYGTDYSTTVPQHLAAEAGTRQNEPRYYADGTAYYDYANNPFENYLLTFKANTQITPDTRLDIDPYLWYGYGLGGTQQRVLNESTTISGSAIGDLNGDADTLDTVRIYSGSVTKTYRPGVTAKLTHTMDNHRIMGGVWLERARHRQTQPASLVGNDGTVYGSIWLDNTSQLVTLDNGERYQGRDWYTISTGKSVFLQDTIDLMNSRLQVTPAISYRHIERDFTSFASAASGESQGYNISASYGKWLPSLGATYAINDRTSAFASVSRNMKVPENTIYSGGLDEAKRATEQIKPEIATNYEIGTRYRGSLFNSSLTAFYVDFRDRIASSYDPLTGDSSNSNVGDATTKGLEFELGTAPIKGWSAYSSMSYTHSTIDQDLRTGASSWAATGGKQFADTPRLMGALSLQYANGPFMANLVAKYTGSRYLTLVNDIKVGGYTLLDLNMAYRLPSSRWIKNPTLRFNVSNLLDREYLLASSGSGSSMAIDKSSTTYVYYGAPRFASLTLQADF